jgi:hypothetical protein
MRIRRTLPVVLAVVVVAAAVTVAVQLRKHAPPEPARLLPGADAFFYVNLTWARKANSGKDLPAVSHDPEYEQFIRETGFQFERDLDEAAFAIHYPANWPGGGSGGAAREPRFSEIFVGKFDGGKLSDYLKGHAKSVENYESVDIFTIPIQDRTVRVAIVGADSVAASNHDDPAVIRGMVDRSRKLASPFGGPALLRRYYKRVQFSSPVWLVAHIEPSAARFQFNDFLPHACDLVVSASYNPLSIPLRLPVHPGAVHVHAEAFTASPDDAREIAAKLTAALALFHTAESAVGSQGTDPDVKAVFDSLQIEQENSHATISATIPPGFLKKLLSESQAGGASSVPPQPALQDQR